MGGITLPSPVQQELAHEFAANAIGALELAAGEITRGQAAEAITHFGHGCRAVISINGGLGVRHERRVEFFARLAPGVHMGDGGFFASRSVDYDRLEPLGTHDRPQAAPGVDA